MNVYRIYLVEDDIWRYDILPKIIDELNCLCSTNGHPFTFQAGFNLPTQTTVENVMDVLADQNKLWEAVTDKYSIFLLDINLTDKFNTKSLSSLRQKLSECDQKIENLLDNNEQILKNAILGNWGKGSLASTISAKRISSKTPLLIVSEAVDVGNTVNVAGYNFEFETCSYPLANDNPNRLRENKKNTAIKIIQVVEDYHESLISYHDDYDIDRALTMYGSQCQRGNNTWFHPKTGSGNASNGMATTHRNQVAKWLSPDISFDTIKALMMVTRNGKQLPNTSGDKSCYDTKYCNIAKQDLDLVLKALGITNHGFQDQCNGSLPWHLPIAPGLTFFLALKEFINNLKSEAPPKKIIFAREDNSGNRLYSVIIELATTRIKKGESKERDCNVKDLIDSYILYNGVHDSDTTRALKKLVACMIDTKINEDWLKIFTDEKYIEISSDPKIKSTYPIDPLYDNNGNKLILRWKQVLKRK